MTEEKKDVSTESVSESAQAASEPAKKKKGKKGKVVAIVVAVIVVLGIGFSVWHEQPSFCAAICHTPMDPYYTTYVSGDEDALGNQLNSTEASSMMSYTHGEAGLTCMSCHVPTLSEQVSEGVAWISGNYEVAGKNADGKYYLDSRTMADLTEARGVDQYQFCQNSTCHADTADSESHLAVTESLGSQYNPHNTARHGEIPCTTCHKAHTQSVNFCTECHASAPVPDGWLTMQEAQEKGIVEYTPGQWLAADAQ